MYFSSACLALEAARSSGGSSNVAPAAAAELRNLRRVKGCTIRPSQEYTVIRHVLHQVESVPAPATISPMHYVIKRAQTRPTFSGDWSSPPWRDANVARINSFRSESGHKPVTEARVLYDSDGLYVIFRVHDRYIVCTRTEHQTLTS